LSIKNLDIKQEYRTDTHPPLLFYIDCLTHCNRFDRAAGYFSSSGLSKAAQGFARFIHDDGKIRMVVSPDFEGKDYDVLKEKYPSNEKIIEMSLLNSIQQIEDEIHKNRFAVLAWLLEEGKLKIKIAVKVDEKGRLQNGIFHEKSGIFYNSSNDEEYVAFTGSPNETGGGLISNFETIDVFTSWNEHEKTRVESKMKHFEELWSNKTQSIEIHDLPSAVKKEIIRRKPITKPTKDFLEETDRFNPDFLRTSSIQIKKPQTPDYIEARDYQDEAVEKWLKNDCIGLFEMATGTGKTITALIAAVELTKSKDKLFTLVLVPSVSLVQQWKKECLNFSFSQIINVYKDNRTWTSEFQAVLNSYKLGNTKFPLIISTYTSFKKSKFQTLSKQIPDDSLLICDEVHHLGAKEAKNIIPENIVNRLGLSATPHRHFDESGTADILNYFNAIDEPTYKLDLRDAINMRALCEYYLHIHEVHLNEDEYENYIDITRQIAKRYAIIKGNFESSDTQLERLLIKRKGIINKATEKLLKVYEILGLIKNENGKVRFTLVYCPEGSGENDDSVLLEYGRMLGLRMNINFKYFVGSTSPADRKNILEDFANGKTDAILAMKCLDEGIDVKRTEVAILVASSTNPRQYIQRRGRVLRTHEDKLFAHIHDLFVLPPVSGGDIDQSIPGDEVDKINEVNKTLITQELRRLYEFATSALNFADNMKIIRNYCDSYGIKDYDQW
jgi:superfamily II DNA or RNA helicase